MNRVGDEMTYEEVWMRAFCAYIAPFNATTERAISSADECLDAFRKRFAGAGTASLKTDGTK